MSKVGLLKGLSKSPVRIKEDFVIVFTASSACGLGLEIVTDS